METASPPPGPATSWRQRLGAILLRTGVPIPIISILLVAHLTFGALRFPRGAVVKRAQEVSRWHETGLVDWHFQLTDEETRRVAHWLHDSVPPDQAVLYRGTERGYPQLLAAVLFPRLMVHERVLGTPAAARHTIFADHAPGDTPTPDALPVVVCEADSLRIAYR